MSAPTKASPPSASGENAERRIVVHIPPQKTMLPRDGREPRTNAQRLAIAAKKRANREPVFGRTGGGWPMPRA